LALIHDLTKGLLALDKHTLIVHSIKIAILKTPANQELWPIEVRTIYNTPCLYRHKKYYCEYRVTRL